MTRTVATIDHHNPLPDGKVELTFDDDTTLSIWQTSEFDIAARHETGGMLPRPITTDAGDIIEIVSNIDQDDVRRTARRLLRIDAWLDDVTTVDDVRVPVVGTYRPGRTQLVLVEAGKGGSMTGIVTPFVAAIKQPFRPNASKALKPRLSSMLEKRAKRKMGSMQRSHYEDGRKQIVATKFREVESLDHADQIIYDDEHGVTEFLHDTGTDTDDVESPDNAGEGEFDGQTSLNSF